MAQLNTEQVLDIFRSGLTNAVLNDQDGLKAVFSRNGVTLPADVNKDQIYATTLTGMAVSPAFKKDVVQYLANNSASFSNYIDDPFSSADGDDPTGSPVKRSITSERIGSYLDLAANLLISSLGSKMRREGEQRAIEFELAQAERIRQEQLAKSPLAEGQKRILVPVAIVLGIAFFGFLGYYLVKNGKLK